MSLIYVMQAAHGVKVGITRREIERRRSNLESQSGIPISIAATFECDPDKLTSVEWRAHLILAPHRAIGEWFNCTAEEAIDAVRQALLPVGPQSAEKPAARTLSPDEVTLEVDRLVAAGIRVELAALYVLGGAATSRQIASVLHGEPPTHGETLSIGRRLYGLENLGQSRRDGVGWRLTERSLAEIGLVSA